MARRPQWKINRANGTPLEGDIACRSGFPEKSNPHDPDSVASRYWRADWCRADAEMYDDWVNGTVEAIEDGRMPDVYGILSKNR